MNIWGIMVLTIECRHLKLGNIGDKVRNYCHVFCLNVLPFSLVLLQFKLEYSDWESQVRLLVIKYNELGVELQKGSEPIKITTNAKIRLKKEKKLAISSETCLCILYERCHLGN